ncbi:G-patch domain [Sesbania bispinosa]|nr:G-patch domain [Sesbania bispinosa]
MIPVTMYPHHQEQAPQGVQWPLYGLPPGYTPPVLTNPPDNHTSVTNTDPQNQAQQLDPGQTTNETSAPPPPFPTFMPYPFLPTTNTPPNTFQPQNFYLDSQGKPIIPQPVPLLVSTTQPKDTVVNDPHSKEKLQILEDRLRAIEGKKKEGETHAVTFEHNNTFQARPGYAPTHFQPNFQPPYMPYPYELCKVGAIEKKGDNRKGAMCAIHPDVEHSIEKCEKFKEVLQSLIDSQLVQISCERDEMGVNVVQESENAQAQVFPKVPTPLTLHGTHNTQALTCHGPRPITIQVPSPFPYKNSKAVPWKYDVQEGAPIVGPHLSRASMMIAITMLEKGYQHGQGLGKTTKGVADVLRLGENKDNFGLGYKATPAYRKRVVEEKKEKRLARLEN